MNRACWKFVFVIVFVHLFFIGAAAQDQATQAFAKTPANTRGFYGNVDWNRLAAIEKIVDQAIEKDQKGATKLLSRIKSGFEQAGFVVQAHSAQTMPRMTALVQQLGINNVQLKTAGIQHPVTKAGLAAMVVDNVIYAPVETERNTSSQDLLAVIAHELGHDPMDSVRKRLYQEIEGITKEELLWLDARLESRAHIKGMKLLAKAGHNPNLIVDYVKRTLPHEFSSDHMDYIRDSVEGALYDIAPTTVAQR